MKTSAVCGLRPVGEHWRDRHRRAWSTKPLLRTYYREEYFDRIVAEMPRGPSLEIGAGAGFFAEYHRCDVVTDVTFAPQIDRVVDVQAMPFDDGAFSSVIGIDVLHHIREPVRALAEIARVLKFAGRLIVIEPWSGPVGTFVNRYLHSEECSPLADPWAPAFGADKDPMDGNATIPKTLFADHAAELLRRTGLKTVKVTPFSCLGFLATGGFSRWQLPPLLGYPIIALERRLPGFWWPFIAVKALIVAERSA